MNDSLVKSLSDSPMVHDSELIAGFFSPMGFAGLILLLVMANHTLFAEGVLWIHRNFMDPFLHRGNPFHARLVGFSCILILVAGHLTEIVIWATSLVMTGLIRSMTKALYYCGSTYTTLGYGSDPMANGRNAITVVIALSGMLTIAMTTSILMSQFSRYHEVRRMAQTKSSTT
jgi:Ion channel